MALFAVCIPGGGTAAPATAAPQDSGFSVANNGGLPAGAALYAQLGVKVYLTGFATLANGCDFSSFGSWQIIQAPQHGTIDFAAVQSYYFGPAQCRQLYPFNGASYTWTDGNTTATTDSFMIRWVPGGSLPNQDLSLVAQRAAPDKPAKCPAAPDPRYPCVDGGITLYNGNKSERVVDYTTAGPNPLGFVRTYNHYAFGLNGAGPGTFAAALGVNWRSNFDRYLQIAPATVVAERPDGSLLSFALVGGVWTSDSDVDVALTQAGSTWTLHDRDDTIETYLMITGAEARLTAIQARNGYTQTLQYNGSQLASVSDSYGRRLAFTYQGGLLATVTTPDGLVVSYAYNSSGITFGVLDRLISVSYSTTPQTGQSYLYQFNPHLNDNVLLPFALTTIGDENGHLRDWAYDGNGRAYSFGFRGVPGPTPGSVIAYNDTDGSVRVDHFPFGAAEVYRFTVLQGVPKLSEIDSLVVPASRQFTYDANGYVASESDWNTNLTTLVNDARGQPVTITEAAGTATQRVTTIAYHANFHLALQIVAPGLTTNFTYDANGNLLTRTAVDTTTNTIPYSTNGQTRTWTFTWEDALLTSVTGPRTDVNQLTRFSYDVTDALIAVRNPLGQVTGITPRRPGPGLPLRIVDPNGVATTLTYDARNRLLTSTVTTAAGARTTHYTYDPVGNATQITYPDGSAAANTYDVANQLVGVATLGGSIAYSYDLALRIVSTGVSDTRGLGVGGYSVQPDPLGRAQRDRSGRGDTAYQYDNNGNLTAITDSLGHITRQAFDALDRLTQITDAASGVTLFAYDPQDHPLKVTDPNGNATFYAYDGFGDVIGQLGPDSRGTVFYYDSGGNLVQRVDAAGTITNWTYDALDRVTATNYPANPAENVGYFYDEAAGGFGIGRLTHIVDIGGTVARTYDERGNLLREMRSEGSVNLATSYTYDAASRLTRITYPSGAAVSYVRDGGGRITAVSVTPPGGNPLPVVGSATYEPFGPPSGFTYGNGITDTRSFDGSYHLTGLTDAAVFASRIFSYQYALGNLTAIGDNFAGNHSFSYDPLNRLTGTSGIDGNVSYNYDAVGNLLTRSSTVNGRTSVTGLTYAPNSNRLLRVSLGSDVVRQFDYTATGNVARDQGTLPARTLALAYNQENRLASISEGSHTRVLYYYDAFGQRLAKSLPGTPGTLTVYQYDRDGHLLEETDLSSGSPRPQGDYIYLGGLAVAKLTPGGIGFLHGDRLGTPQFVTDSRQGVPWLAAYDGFGDARLVVESVVQNLRFPGQYADIETGYYHNGARHYDPTIGRYLESDPIGVRGGLNSYAYAGNNPMTYADPSGLAPVDGGALAQYLYDYAGGVWNPEAYYGLAGPGTTAGPMAAPNRLIWARFTPGKWGRPSGNCAVGAQGLAAADLATGAFTPDQLARLILGDPDDRREDRGCSPGFAGEEASRSVPQLLARLSTGLAAPAAGSPASEWLAFLGFRAATPGYWIAQNSGSFRTTMPR